MGWELVGYSVVIVVVGFVLYKVYRAKTKKTTTPKKGGSGNTTQHK